MLKQNENLKSFYNIDRSKWLININDTHVPDDVLKFLSLDSFGVPLKHTNKIDRQKFTLDVIKNFESNSHFLQNNLVDDARTLIANTLNRYLSHSTHINYPDTLHR
jgi:hypothetical protein